MTFIYDLDLGRHRLSIKSELTLLMFLRNFLIGDKSRSFASLLVVITILLLVIQMKSVMMSDLEFFRHLLTLVMWIWAELTINSVICLVIGIMTSFLNGPLVVILILGFLLPFLLFFAFNIFPTSSTNKEGNTSLTCKTSSMLYKTLDFEAYI